MHSSSSGASCVSRRCSSTDWHSNLLLAAYCNEESQLQLLSLRASRFKQVSTIIMYNDHHDHLAYKLHVAMLVGGVEFRVYLRLSGIAKLVL